MTRTPLRAKLLIALATCALAPELAKAQAWLAPRGETTLAWTFEASEFHGHLLSNGERAAVGATASRSLLFEIDHSFSDHFAVRLGVPYVAVRNGHDPSPVAGHTGLDDGRYHATLQDFRIALRYNLLQEPLVVTPFVRGIVPSHHYETQAEAAPGRDLLQGIVGIDVGRVLISRAADFYIHAELSYAFVEKSEGISTNRTDGSLAIGWFATPELVLSALGSFQETHGGITIDQVLSGEISHEQFEGHDRLLDDDNHRAGVSVSYQITPSWSIDGTWITVVSGSDTHYGDTYILGVQHSLVPKNR
jgi:hypothetical protein